MADANDILFGKAAPGAKFPNVGDSVTGVILELGARQRNAYDPDKAGCQGGPLWWQNGKPVELDANVANSMALQPVTDAVITIQTEDRDPEDEMDDGRRRLFVSARLLADALRQAAKDAKVRKFEVGGTLTVTHDKMGKPAKKGARAPKSYVATYTAPDPDAAAPEEEDPWA